MRKLNYESDAEFEKAFPAPAYQVEGYKGIAWHAMGWETAPDEDTEWSGIEPRTGNIVAIMVGDDRRFAFTPDDLTPLTDDDYCGSCGQIGCRWG